MVDKEKRDAVKKIGTVGALLLGGAGGKVYWWDRRDDHINPDNLEQSIEERAAEQAGGGGGGWDAAVTDLSRAEATLEPRDTTQGGGKRYDAVLEIPLEDDAVVCDHTGEPVALASTLERDANDAFAAVYNATHAYAAADQEPFEDGIEAYELRFTGERGAAMARFTSDQAADIGGGALLSDPYQPDDSTDAAYQAFVETYYDVFNVECDIDG